MVNPYTAFMDVKTEVYPYIVSNSLRIDGNIVAYRFKTINGFYMDCGVEESERLLSDNALYKLRNGVASLKDVKSYLDLKVTDSGNYLTDIESKAAENGVLVHGVDSTNNFTVYNINVMSGDEFNAYCRAIKRDLTNRLEAETNDCSRDIDFDVYVHYPSFTFALYSRVNIFSATPKFLGFDRLVRLPKFSDSLVKQFKLMGIPIKQVECVAELSNRQDICIVVKLQ